MSRAMLALILIAMVTTNVHAAAPPTRMQWVAIVAPEFVDALAPLIKTRRAQGMKVVLLKTSDVLTEKQLLAGDATKLRDRVHTICRAHRGDSIVLLVGAIDSIFAGRIVPPCLGNTGRMKGEPTDVPYGCPDGERLPTVAVGRFPARNVDEVKAMVEKTLALEAAGRKPGAWKRRLTVLAGIPAYNALVDRLVESMAMSRFDRIHPAWVGRAVYTNPLSRFCLPYREMRTKALDYLRDGQAFTLYLGHSNAQEMYGGPKVAFLDRADWGKATLPHGGGVLVSFGCNGCQLKGLDGEGYGLWAIRNPKGPAAAIGSHGICYAAMVNLAADGLFQQAFAQSMPGRLGTAWLGLLQGVAKGRIDFLSYRALDAVDGDPRVPQALQRQEHLEMFVLLGDPALRLPRIDDLALDVPPLTCSGSTITITGQLPDEMSDATVEVRLQRLPSRAPAGLVAVPRQPGTARDAALRTNHEKANQFALLTKKVTAKGTTFRVELQVPGNLPATTCILRVYAATKERDALAARRIEVRPRAEND